MPVLTPAQLTACRQRYAESGVVQTTKGPINAALQAVEDYFETTARAGIAAAIEAAAPGVFTGPQKKRLVKQYLLLKFGLE